MIKRLLVLTTILIGTSCAMGQKSNLDPSYSFNNYKHPNKVNVVRAHHGQKPVILDQVVVTGGPEYKHRFNQSWFSVKGAIQTRRVAKPRVTAKHPLGM